MVSPEKSPSSSKKLPDHRRSDTSSSGRQPPVTSSIGVATTSTSILDSVTGIPQPNNSTKATIGNLLGQTADDTGTRVIQELRPPGTSKGNRDWYDECTESLGYESLVAKKDMCDVAEVIDEEPSSSSRSKTTRMYGMSRETTSLKDFPPLIPTLDSSGRPRFRYEKVTGSDGRLRINMVESNRPDLVHYTTVGDDGESMVRKAVVRRDQEPDDGGKNKEEMTADVQKNEEEMMTDDSEDNDAENKKRRSKTQRRRGEVE